MKLLFCSFCLLLVVSIGLAVGKEKAFYVKTSVDKKWDVFLDTAKVKEKENTYKLTFVLCKIGQKSPMNFGFNSFAEDYFLGNGLNCAKVFGVDPIAEDGNLPVSWLDTKGEAVIRRKCLEKWSCSFEKTCQPLANDRCRVNDLRRMVVFPNGKEMCCTDASDDRTKDRRLRAEAPSS